MKVLSIRQPFAWTLTNGYQDVENRNRPWNYVGPVLIHAGRDFDSTYTDPSVNNRRALEFLLEHQRAQPWTLRYLYGPDWDWPALPDDDELERGGIVGVTYMGGCERWTWPRLDWQTGPYCYAMEYALPLPFTPAKGRLEPWDAGADLLDAVKAVLWSDRGALHRTRLRTLLEVNRTTMPTRAPDMWNALWKLYGEESPGPGDMKPTDKTARIHLDVARKHLPGLVPIWERILQGIA